MALAHHADASFVLTGGVTDYTREQPCMPPHPHGVGPSPCSLEVATTSADGVALTKDAHHLVRVDLHP